MKPRESDVYSEARYSQLRGQLARGGESRRVVVETCRSQFIANLPVKLLMERFGRRAIQPDHFKSHHRMATPFPIEVWCCMSAFGVRRFLPIISESMRTRREGNYPSKVVWPFRPEWTVDTSPLAEALVQMQTQTPCTDYIETKGLIYFARMLDKIRLKADGKLSSEYFTGVEDPTHFDARCTRFLGVNYGELVERTLQGGSDDEILEWCFARGRRPSDEEISVWNAFLQETWLAG